MCAGKSNKISTTR